MSWWWWGAATKKAAGGSPPPAALTDLSTEWAPVVWKYAQPLRQLAFQPCSGCCDCRDWEDAFEREAIGDDWEVISGTWSIAEDGGGPSYGDNLVLTSASGTIVTSRRLNRGNLVATLGQANLAAFPTGAKLRIYFDWTDADNNQYFEASCALRGWPAGPSSTAVTVALGGDAPIYSFGQLSLCKTEGGVVTVLDGPEEWLAPEWTTFHVAIWDTGNAGEKYVIGGWPAVYHGSLTEFNSWVGSRTTLTGTKCGLGGEIGSVWTQIDFRAFTNTDCYSLGVGSAVQAIDTGMALYGYVGRQYFASSQAFHAKPCGYALNTGSYVSGDILDPDSFPLILQSDNGLLDVVFTVYFRGTSKYGYLEANYTGGSAADVTSYAAWNFTRECWESNRNPVLIHDQHVDSEGRAAIRVRVTTLDTDPYQFRFYSVVGGRQDYPLPSFRVVLGSEWPTPMQGTYDCTWDPEEFSRTSAQQLPIYGAFTGVGSQVEEGNYHFTTAVRVRFLEDVSSIADTDSQRQYPDIEVRVSCASAETGMGGTPLISVIGTASQAVTTQCGVLSDLTVPLTIDVIQNGAPPPDYTSLDGTTINAAVSAIPE